MSRVPQQALAILEELLHLPLEERVPELVRRLSKEGLHEGYARPAAYGIPVLSQAATSLIVEHHLQPKFGAFVACHIGHPNSAVATTIKRIGTHSHNVIDTAAADGIAGHILDVDSDDDEPRPLPWPVVWGAGAFIVMEFAAASGLDTPTNVVTRGYHVDAFTAEVLRERELAVLTVSRTPAAASVQEHSIEHTVTKPLKVSHLLAKETLGGDCARSRVFLQVKKIELLPSGRVLPPTTIAKPGARLDVDLMVDDVILPDLRYTSAGAAGTVTLALSFIGCRRYA